MSIKRVAEEIQNEAVRQGQAVPARKRKGLAERAEGAVQGDGSGTEVQISELSRELSAMDVKALDEQIRKDKVAELKDRIARGEYDPSSEEVARKLIADLF